MNNKIDVNDNPMSRNINYINYNLSQKCEIYCISNNAMLRKL